jgi:hypothetical protein
MFLAAHFVFFFMHLAVSSLLARQSSLRFFRLATPAASCLPNGAKVRSPTQVLEHLSIDVSFAGPEHFQLGRESFMMQVCIF